VAGILTALSDNNDYPSARILVIDIHGEYGKALGDRASIFRVNPDPSKNERALYIPYWAMTLDELLPVTLGSIDNGGDRGAVIDKITELKLEAVQNTARVGVSADSLSVDTPVPFCIHKFWFDLHCEMRATHHEEQGQPQSPLTRALEKGSDGKPFAVLTRKVIKEEMKARTPSQAGNLLSALRGVIRWMIDEDHLDEDDDPTIGLKSGKAKASRETGGFLPWTEEDMAHYRAKWPHGTEARLMFDVLHYTFLRLGDAYRFGPPHLRQIVRKMSVQIATEKSRGNTTVTVPVHPEFAESLRAARAAGIIGAEVFIGKMVKGRVLPMNKKAWAAKFKKYAVLAGVNEPKKSCHGVRKARAEVAAYADCTESQMMAMFGWTDPKMPAHYIAQANREKLGMTGMDKIVAFDQSDSRDDFVALPDVNRAGTSGENRVVTLRSNIGKKVS
jgi:integrase